MTNKLFILYFHKIGARICGNYYGGIMYKDIFINLSLFKMKYNVPMDETPDVFKEKLKR